MGAPRAQPNKNIVYPEEHIPDDDKEDDTAEAAADVTTARVEQAVELSVEAAATAAAGLASGAVRRPLELKRKAAASPSPRKPATRSYTPRSAGKGEGGAQSSCKKDALGSAQDDVSMKRRMLRAKLAEADSPLPPPTRMLP
jgi:hypothetical protein